MGTAEWLLASEGGWGFPHVWVAMLAALVIGVRIVSQRVAAIIARTGRASSGR